MNRTATLLAISTAFLIAGCPTRSLSPLFADRDTIFNPSLIGTWVGTGKEATTITFRKSGEKDYIVTQLEKNDSLHTLVKLGRLGRYWFLDFSQDDNTCKSDFLIPAHFFSKMSLKGDSLTLAFLDGDGLKVLKERGQLKVAHAIINNSGGILTDKAELVLTASTNELQRFVHHIAEDTKAFPEPELFIRKK